MISETIKIHSSEDEYNIKQSCQYKEDDYWDWSVWIESSESGLDKIENVITTSIAKTPRMATTTTTMMMMMMNNSAKLRKRRR